MKIFNWVHRKFHHKEGFGGNAKKPELVNTETETQMLLEHITIDGILTIGTLGYNPLSQFNEGNEFLVVESEECEVEEENEGTKVCEIEEVNALKSEIGPYEVGLDLKEFEDDVGEKKKEKERITLAELLMVDSVVNIEGDCGKVNPDFNKKSYVHGKKKGLSFAKKLIPSFGDDKLPIKKLHQMMKRMMKRKIHPDLEEEIQKRDDNHIKPTRCGLLADEHGAKEKVSLLRTEDSIV